MPRFEITPTRYLDYWVNDSDKDIYLRRAEEPKNPIRLNPIQAFQMFNALETIEDLAEEAWKKLSDGSKKEYSCHIGWNVFVTLLEFRGEKYFDVRRWWVPPSQANAVPTKIGIRLSKSNVATLKNFRADLVAAVPEIGDVGPCDCFLGTQFLTCLRCNPYWYVHNKN